MMGNGGIMVGMVYIRANADILDGWWWRATLSECTCQVCWAMNGSIHALEEDLSSHPDCRCVQVPIAKTFAQINAEYGYESGGTTDTSYVQFDADEKFRESLTKAQQIKILGPEKFSLWEDGKITLADLVQPTHHRGWGPGLRATTLRELAERGIVPRSVSMEEDQTKPRSWWQRMLGA